MQVDGEWDEAITTSLISSKVMLENLRLYEDRELYTFSKKTDVHFKYPLRFADTRFLSCFLAV